jgi:hypothetical protein
VYDLARLYLDIINSAAIELDGGKGVATWGNDGYYFAETGVHYWQDVTAWLAEEADKQGFLKSGNILTLGSDEEEVFKTAGLAIFNSTRSCKSIRAKKLFGWDRRERELKDEIAEIVRSEAELAGITNTVYGEPGRTTLCPR